MKSLVFYRIITYPLLLVAGFLAFGVIATLPTAIANPPLLLIPFLISCVIIYTYTSWRFLNKGIDQQMPLKHSLRDLIRVNSFCTIAVAVYCLVRSAGLLSDPGFLKETAREALSAPGAPGTTSEEFLTRVVMGTLIFLSIYSVLLLVHVFMTLRLLKPYRYLFDQQPKEPNH